MEARMPAVETGSSGSKIPLQLVLAGGSAESVEVVVLCGVFPGANPEFSPLTSMGTQLIEPPLSIENRLIVAAIILVPVVGAIVQIKRSVIGFVEINPERRRLKMASVEGDGIIQRLKDPGVQPIACGEIDSEREEKKAQAQAQAKQGSWWHCLSV